MLKKIIIFFTTLLLVLNLSLTNAVASEPWVLSNPTAVGASVLYNGLNGSITSSILMTPNASQVAKVLSGGIAVAALAMAVDQLLGAVDWVLDPENNQIRYTEKISSTDSADLNDPTRQYLWKVDGGSPAGLQLTPELACKAYTAISCDSVSIIDEALYNVWGCWTYPDQKQSCGQVAHRIINPAYNPDAKKPENTLSLETIAQQVIENAEDDDVDAQVAILAAAAAIVAAAENDNTLGQPIADQLENNSKCPSGIVRNGSCWICDKSQFMPITRATRDAKTATRGKSCKNVTDTAIKTVNATLFRNLINARIQENSCWSPPDPNHAIAVVDAQNALSLCEN